MTRPGFLALLLALAGPLHAQVNDFCGDVTPVSLAVGGSVQFTGDNTGATFDGDFAPGSTLGGLGIPCTWHAFTVTTCADITVDYCGTTPAFTEFWNVLATTCPASNAYIATQQYEYVTCGDGNPTMRFLNVPPATYYFPVWYDAAAASGPYTINVSAAACGTSVAPNDNCADAVPEVLSPGGELSFTGDNTFATSTGDFAAGTPFAAAPVVWHAFTLTECTRVTVAYCGQSPAWGNTLGVLTRDCPGSDLVYFSTVNTTDCGDGNSSYIFSSLAAGTYYVPVLLSPGTNAIGAYELTISGEACPPPASYQDNCASVQFQPLAVGGTITFEGDNSSATGAGDFPEGSPFNGAPVVWHGISTATCTRLTIAYCGQDPVWGNTFGFLARDCPASDLVFFTNTNSTDCVEGNVTYVYANLPAGDYLIPVVRDPGNNAIGPYTIQVSAASCPAVPPANDACTNATPVVLDALATLTFTGDNTNATSGGDFVPGSPFAAAPVTWHAFTTEQCADLLVDYCGLEPAWTNTLGILATACPGDGLVYFTTTTSTCTDGNSTYLFNDLQAGTYYLPVLRDALNGSFGPYSIAVTAEDCLFLGDARPAAFEGLALWPNPAADEVNLAGVPVGAQLRILDAAGRIVLEQRATQSGRQRISTAGRLSPGSYTLLVQAAAGQRTFRLVVHR